jgi:hypothetical protein
MNSINQLFEVGFKDIIPHLQSLSFKPSNRHKIIDIDKPVKIILKLIEYGGNIQHYKEEARATIKHLYEPPKPRKMRLIIVNKDKEDDESCNDKLTKTLKLKVKNNLVILPITKKAILPKPKNIMSPPSSPPKIIMPKLNKK